jgi:hypothetical protein
MPPRPQPNPERTGRLSPDELDQVVRFRLADVMREELSRKHSEPDALRKALLTLIALAADRADEATRQFVDYLLTHFTPLAGKTGDPAQPVWRRHALTRAREPGGTHLRLAAPPGMVAELLKDVPGVGGGTGS